MAARREATGREGDHRRWPFAAALPYLTFDWCGRLHSRTGAILVSGEVASTWQRTSAMCKHLHQHGIVELHTVRTRCVLK